MSTGPSHRAEPELSVRIGNLTLSNPVMPASGTYDWHPGDGHPLDPDELGAIVTKSITVMERQGNPPHRAIELPGAMINSIGIPSKGFGSYRDRMLKPAAALRTRVITSIAGFSADEFGQLCSLLEREPRVDAIELNLSCPNIETDSIFATDVAAMSEIIRFCRPLTSKPLIAKLSPNVSDIVPFVEAAEAEGSDALCIANTFTGMAIDIRRRAPIIGNVRGGVTGPGLMPIILYHVWNAARHTSLPIIASGGIFRTQDAIQFLLAGACAVQIGTANFKDPVIMRTIIKGISEHLLEEGIADVNDLIGLANKVRKGAVVDA